MQKKIANLIFLLKHKQFIDIFVDHYFIPEIKNLFFQKD